MSDTARARDVEDSARQVTRDETRRSSLLWLAVLGSPLAWAAHLVVNYATEEWFACSPSATTPGEMLGVSVGTFSVVFNSLMLAISLLAGVAAVVCLRRHDRRADTSTERARWMAFAATIESALFSGIIVLGYAPVVVLDTCRTLP